MVAGGGCARKIDDDGGHSSRTFSTRHRTGCILLTFGLRRRALENPSFARRRVRPSGRRLRRIFSVSSAPPPTTSLLRSSALARDFQYSALPLGCTKTCLPRRRLPGTFLLILARGLSFSFLVSTNFGGVVKLLISPLASHRKIPKLVSSHRTSYLLFLLQPQNNRVIICRAVAPRSPCCCSSLACSRKPKQAMHFLEFADFPCLVRIGNT